MKIDANQDKDAITCALQHGIYHYDSRKRVHFHQFLQSKCQNPCVSKEPSLGTVL